MCGAYAPELNIVGAVLGSPVGDLGHTFRRLNGTFYSGLPAMVVAALSHAYPDLDRVIQEHATDEGKAMLARLEQMTTAHAVLRLVGMDMGNLVDRPLEEILDTPEVQHVFDEHQAGHRGADSAGADRAGGARPDRVGRRHRRCWPTPTAPAAPTVTYHRDMFSEHMLLHPMSAPMTLRWLTDRFAGRPLSEHLVARTKWPTLLNPMTYRGMARLARIAAKVLTRTGGRAPSTVTAAPAGTAGSSGGQAPRSSRAVDTASSAYTRARHRGGEQQRRPRSAAACARRTPTAPR